MKIRVPLVIDLDADKWAHYNGISKSDVRDDVRKHLLNVAQNLDLLDEADATVELGK